MAAVQTVYATTIAVGLEGDTASSFDADSVETRICETAAGIAFGRAVSEGTNTKGAVIGGETGFIGITLRDITLVAQAGQTVDLYQLQKNMSIRLAGDVWVVAVAAVAHGAPATYDAITGQLNPAADGIAIPGSRFLTSAGAGGLAVLRLTTPAPGPQPSEEP
jgi:hypothetical protein